MEQETKKEIKKNWTRWWLLGCVGIAAVLLLLTFVLINYNRNVSTKNFINTQNFTPQEIKEYLQEKGYSITAKKSTYTKYIYVSKDEIAFQRIDSTFIGTSYCWKNSDINGEWTDIQEGDDKKTKLTEIVQYVEYTQWLKEINLSKSQIIDVLDYCYKNMEFEEFILSSDNKTSSEKTDDNSISNSTSNEITNNNISSSSTSSGTTSNNSSSSSTSNGTTSNNSSSNSSTSSGTSNSNTSSSNKPSGTTNSNTSSNSKPSGTTNNNTSNNSSSSITISQQNAVRRAKEYLSVMPFSKGGLIAQLEYEKFSNADATYGAENCGANWNEQALKKAKVYLNTMPFSYQGLISQLEYDKFTNAQATYGAENCGANWNEQAAKKAKSYLSFMSFSRDGLISQLQYDKFTYEQAVYGVEANGL